MSCLHTDCLYCSFGNLVVTNNLSLTVEHGERHVIIGPNGAGKTSLINQIGGQLLPSSGRVFFKGVDITGWSPDRLCRAGIARTFQRNNLFLNLSALENVRMAVQARRGYGLDFFTPVSRLADTLARANEVLRRVGLDRDSLRLARNLSYGEQRQLEIAMALAGEPELLLLDEPTSGMSPAETNSVVELIAALPRNIAILMIEHDMNVVFSLADRISVLYYGAILASGTAAEIQADERVREVYLGVRH